MSNITIKIDKKKVTITKKELEYLSELLEFHLCNLFAVKKNKTIENEVEHVNSLKEKLYVLSA